MNVVNEIDSNATQRNHDREKSTFIVFSDEDDEEEEEDYDTAIGIKPRQNAQKQRNKLCIDDDSDDNFSNENDDDGDDGGDDESYLSPLEHDDKENKNGNNHHEKRKNHPDSVIKIKNHIGLGDANQVKKKTPNPKPRKRRRSSARFLRLSGRFDGDNGDENEDENDDGMGLIGGETAEEKQQKLGEMYRRAIRLNAENKINVGNSWGLNLKIG